MRAGGAAEGRDEVQLAGAAAGRCLVIDQQPHAVGRHHAGEERRDEEQQHGRGSASRSADRESRWPAPRAACPTAAAPAASVSAATRQQQAQSSQARVVLRIASARQVAQRQRQHEDRDQRAPHVDAAAEVRRQHAAAQQLHAHHEEAGPEGDQVADGHRGPAQQAARSWLQPSCRVQGVAARISGSVTVSDAAPAAPGHAAAQCPPPTVRRHRPRARIRPSAPVAAPSCRPDSAAITASSCALQRVARGHRPALRAGMRAELAGSRGREAK